MTDIDFAEVEQAKVESVATMRVVADRCEFAGAMAKTLNYLMEHRPGMPLLQVPLSPEAATRCTRERIAQTVLADALQDYLDTTTTMVRQIRIQQLEIDIIESTVKGAE